MSEEFEEGREHNEEYYNVHGKDVYSTQSILASLGVKQEDTIYKDSSNDFIRWPFSAADFFEAVSDAPLDPSAAEDLLEGDDKVQVEKINAEIKGYKDSGNTVANQDRIKELRAQKKDLLAKAALKADGAKISVVYKTFVQINDSKMVEKKLPQFKNVKWPYKDQMPYFAAGLEDFAAAVARGEPTAITGGPCFFGEHEVDMIFTLRDGSQKIYDFTTRRRNAGDKVSLEAEYTKENADEVVDVSFVSHKKLLTTEEYDSVLYLFELAQATKSALTLPIVDASYLKYLDAMVEPLSIEVRVRARKQFRQVAKPIIEMYRELFDVLKKKYPDVKETFIMTGEDKELLETFYSKREPFVEKPSTRRIISGIKEKIDSVKDYITLPALPLYFLGIKNVLEVDYIGETDSFWKCRKMHKGEMNLSALLYPIKISADGWRSIFSTDLQYKEYIERDDYGKR
ncbi:MAG: hypothetical protein IK094_05735 [Treponema sp.]|nr:hypothetical protein [Treponema sp.]